MSVAATIERSASPPEPLSRRLKIAFVVHDYNRVLGHSRYVTELAERFAREHEVHVFANTFEGVGRGIIPHRVPALRTSALATIYTFLLPASISVLARRFDIIHAQGLSVLKPDVITAHICNARWLDGRRKQEGSKLSWAERVFGALVIPAERRALSSGQVTVIAVSGALREDIGREYDRSADTAVIPHGVDQEQFNMTVREQHRADMRSELGLSEEEVLFLYVGDLRKGFNTAVRALRHLTRARLLAVSRTPPGPFEQLAADCGVARRVAVHGPTSRIERYYAAADALVAPTPYDAFGMVITEAMACGLPVITTRSAGASELLRDGVHGLLLSSNTDVTLAHGMRSLAQDADVRRRMSVAAAALMRAHSWDDVAERTMHVYRRHLGRRSRRASV